MNAAPSVRRTEQGSGVWADGLALGASALITSGAGLIGWLIASRLLPADQVGVASTFVNSFLLVAAVAELGLGPAMLRWLPLAGARTGTIVLRTYLAVTVTATIAAVVWFLVVADTLDDTIHGATFLVFVLSGIGWTFKQLQDQVLTGMGAARWVPLENLLFSLARLAFLVLTASTWGAAGIVLSWLVPAVIAVLVVTIWIWRRAGALRPTTGGALPSRSQVLGFAAPVYGAALCVAALYNVVPLLVTLHAGPAMGAVFFVVWMGMNTLDLAITGFVNALVVRLAAGVGDARRWVFRTATRLYAVLLPVLLIAFLVADPVLRLFGADYADHGTGLLRLILLGFIGRVGVVLAVGVHQSAGRGTTMAALQGCSAAGTALGVFWVEQNGITAMGWSFVITESLLAAVAWVLLSRRPDPAARSDDPS